MEQYYNKHYITVQDGLISDGWSDGPHRGRQPAEDDILINGKGGYQFRLFPDGQENPPIRTFDGIPLYSWDGEKVVKRSDADIEADREVILAEQKRRDKLAQLHKNLQDTDYIAAKIAEGAATREEYAEMLEQRHGWREEINRLEGTT